jgi:flavin-dependent dehydrogenase
MGTTAGNSDVLVVGAGPAGLAAAIAAAHQGLEVEVIDAMRPPIDKACGEGLMPDSLAILKNFGLDLTRDVPPSETVPLHGIRLISQPTDSVPRDTVAEASFLADPGRGVRRVLLHQLLLDRAASLGVRFHWETVVQGISQSNGATKVRTNRRPLHARYLIGADGHRSRIAKWAGLSRSTVHSSRIGLRQHYTVAPWTNFVEVYFSEDSQAYVTPISTSKICVAFISNRKFPNPAQALACFPELARLLASATPSDAPRGAISVGVTLHRVASGNIALLGDASGSVDAITGEGMALCFRQAVALAESLKSGDLTAYQIAHRRIQRLPGLMSRSLLLIGHSPRLRRHTLNTFRHNPWLFERLLQLHVGHSSQYFFGVDSQLQPDYTC